MAANKRMDFLSMNRLLRADYDEYRARSEKFGMDSSFGILAKRDAVITNIELASNYFLNKQYDLAMRCMKVALQDSIAVKEAYAKLPKSTKQQQVCDKLIETCAENIAILEIEIKKIRKMSLFSDYSTYTNWAEYKVDPFARIRALHDRVITCIEIADIYFLEGNYEFAHIYINRAFEDIMSVKEQYATLPRSTQNRSECDKIIKACMENSKLISEAESGGALTFPEGFEDDGQTTSSDISVTSVSPLSDEDDGMRMGR